MSVRRFSRNALIAASAAFLPVHAVAAAPTPVAEIDRIGAPADDSNNQFDIFGAGYLLPVIIVIALGVGLYFALEGDPESP